MNINASQRHRQTEECAGVQQKNRTWRYSDRTFVTWNLLYELGTDNYESCKCVNKYFSMPGQFWGEMRRYEVRTGL